MGAGDVKLLGVVGSFLGPWGAVVAGFATMMAGAVLGLTVIAWQRLWPVIRPHAAHLFGGHVPAATVSTSPTVAQRTPGVTKIAYAPAIAAGTLTALWYAGHLPHYLVG